LKQLHGQFEHLSKEDILRRLITTQLDHLMINPESGRDRVEADLNEMQGKSSGKRGKPGVHRYFVNIGSIDGVTKADLIHFLSDVSGVDRKYFGQLSMQKNCAYIDVDSDHDKGLSNAFNGIQIEGRDIRVNRDEDKTQHSGKSSSRNKFRGKRRNPKQEFRKSGRKRRY
jgi:ATP-dependent RNA helicase DeaD